MNNSLVIGLKWSISPLNIPPILLFYGQCFPDTWQGEPHRQKATEGAQERNEARFTHGRSGQVAWQSYLRLHLQLEKKKKTEDGVKYKACVSTEDANLQLILRMIHY